MSQPKTTWSQHQLRAELEAYVLGDLLGPTGGEAEEITERTVWDGYLVAILGSPPFRFGLTHTICDERQPEYSNHNSEGKNSGSIRIRIS